MKSSYIFSSVETWNISFTWLTTLEENVIFYYLSKLISRNFAKESKEFKQKLKNILWISLISRKFLEKSCFEDKLCRTLFSRNFILRVRGLYSQKKVPASRLISCCFHVIIIFEVQNPNFRVYFTLKKSYFWVWKYRYSPDLNTGIRYWTQWYRYRYLEALNKNWKGSYIVMIYKMWNKNAIDTWVENIPLFR